MSKKWRRISLALLLALAVIASGIAVFGDTGTANAQPVWSEATVAEQYDYGTEFEVPARTVTLGQTTVKAASVVEYPDGSATKQTKIILNQCGRYSLRYTVISNGAPYIDEVRFTVVDALYTFGDKKSSAYYGRYDSIAAGATKAVATDGLMVSLAEGDKLTFNKLIDVKGLSKDQSLIEAFVTPAVMGKVDFKLLRFTFTDAFNPNVFLRFSARQSRDGDDYPYSFILAGGNGQPMTGYQSAGDKLHVNNEWGTPCQHTFTGKFSRYDEFALDAKPLRIRYDEDENAAYVDENGNSDNSWLIVDFDDPKYFGTFWKGFESGYAVLSIEASMYSNAMANFCITKLRGVDLSATAVDTDAPSISVDTEYSVMPEARVGGEYPVPTATAYDVYCGNTAVKTSVYYNYASPNAVIVPVANGRFVADKRGDYAVVYRATNTRGKSAEKILWVHAGNAIDEITVSSAQIGTAVDATLGQLVQIAPITAAGGSGNLEIKTTVTAGGRTIEFADAFRPEQTGEHIVTVTATDYIGSVKTATFTVNATIGDKPVFVDTPALPDYFIGGGTYILPEVYANDYTTGVCVRKLATAEIDGKTYRAGEKFVPAVENNGDCVTVIFQCENATLPVPVKTVKTYVENDGYEDLHMENYLIGEDVQCTPTDDSIRVDATSENGSWTFANTLLSENFELQLLGAADGTAFDALAVYLTDSVDKNTAICIKLLNAGNKAGVSVGNSKLGLSYGFAAGSFTLGFAGKAVSIDGAELEAKTCLNGKPFDGFPSGRVMLSVAFENAVPNRAGYCVSKINGQPMNNGVDDRIGPKISVMSRNYGGCVSIGETKVIPRAMAGDTLDPCVEFSLTLTAPDGSIATDENGTPLRNVDPTAEYKVKFDRYGQYIVSYQAKDVFAGVSSKWTYAITVEDEIAPEIKFDQPFVTSVKVGGAIVIPDFTVTDNVTESDRIIVVKSVRNPYGETIAVPANSNSMICTQAGVYELRIMVADEAGNVTMVRVKVTVTQA